MLRDYSIFFIRHGKFSSPYKYKDHSEMPFGVLADLASTKLDPSVDRKNTKALIKEIYGIVPLQKIEKIYTSPLKRCKQTSSLLVSFIKQNFKKELDIEIIPELQEIQFDLRKIIESHQRKNLDIKMLNNSVFKAMISNQYCESILDAYKRIGRIFSILNNKKKALLITHDFLMRIIELYIKNKGNKSALITYDDLRNTKRNLYIRGFATNFSLSKFLSF